MVDLIGVVLSVEDARVRGGGLWCLGPGVPCDSTGNLWLQARWWALSCRAGEDEQGEGREGAGGYGEEGSIPPPRRRTSLPSPPSLPPPLPVQNITRKTGEEVTKRAVVIRDRSGGSIELTLWGAAAADPGQALHDMVVQVGGSCVCVCGGGGAKGTWGPRRAKPPNYPFDLSANT